MAEGQDNAGLTFLGDFISPDQVHQGLEGRIRANRLQGKEQLTGVAGEIQTTVLQGGQPVRLQLAGRQPEGVIHILIYGSIERAHR